MRYTASTERPAVLYCTAPAPQDLLLYSAKVIPGNEGKVTKMLNALASQGARVRQGRADNLHTSGAQVCNCAVLWACVT